MRTLRSLSLLLAVLGSSLARADWSDDYLATSGNGHCTDETMLDSIHAGVVENISTTPHKSGNVVLLKSTLDTSSFRRLPTGMWIARWNSNGTPIEAQYFIRFVEASQLMPSGLTVGGGVLREVTGATPVIQLVNTQECDADIKGDFKLKGRSALILVTGVNNPDRGMSWDKVDRCLLRGAVAWNSRPDWPRYKNKLDDFPAYIQIVPNRGGAGVPLFSPGGADWNVDQQAVDRLVENLALAYQSGVWYLELVTHSNGAITAQMAIRRFMGALNHPSSDAATRALADGWETERKKRTAENMWIYVNSLQPANGWWDPWLSNTSTSDYYGSAANRNNEGGFTFFWQDGASFGYARHAASSGKPTGWAVRARASTFFYVNAGDGLTYRDYSTVGRSEIQKWFRNNWPSYLRYNELNFEGWERRMYKWNCFNCGPVHSFQKAIFRYPMVGYSEWARYDPSDNGDFAVVTQP